VLKKLLAWVAVLLVAALLAVPALAQENGASAGGLTAAPGENAFGAGGSDSAFTAAICRTLQQDPAVWKQNLEMDPGLAERCPSPA
jgi:hypothetical protein